MLFEILLVWIIGIPLFAIAGAAALARRRARLIRESRVARRGGGAFTQPGILGGGRFRAPV